ncbi:MAG: hypothetical protein ABIZ80_20315, partial [Bryobacteraceae bacterium]
MPILIVADKPDLRSTLQRILEELGQEAQPAAGAWEAYRLAFPGSHSAALVVLPLEGTSASAFLEKWKTNFAPAPAFLILESASLEEISAVIASGALDYAGQPLSTQALRERILR